MRINYNGGNADTDGQNYPVQLNNDDQMYVNVPWTDPDTQLGTAASDNIGGVRINYNGGNADPDGPNYPVQLNNNDQMVSYIL